MRTVMLQWSQVVWFYFTAKTRGHSEVKQRSNRGQQLIGHLT